MTEQESSREQLLIKAFVGLADTLVDNYDVIDLLDRLAAYSVRLLAADAVGILLADSRQSLQLVASTSEQSELTEILQLQANEGPCVECFRTGVPVTVIDLEASAARWPNFTAAAGSGGYPFRSVHALPLRLRGQGIGALGLFHRNPGALPVADLELGQALADVATIGILQERAIQRSEVLNEQLQSALTSRVIIEQAKGVLAQRGGLSMEEAFDRLRSYSRHHNLRLSEVARNVVETDLANEVLVVRAGKTRARRS